MRRRDFIAALGSAAASWPLTARAQRGERVRRVGVLMNLAADDLEASARISALQRSLYELGWVEPRNIAFEIKYADGRIDLYLVSLRNSWPLTSTSLSAPERPPFKH